MTIRSALGLTAVLVFGAVGSIANPPWIEAQVVTEPLPPGVTMEMVDRGREVFEGDGLCFSCHGPDGHGLIGPDLTDSVWLQAKGSYLSILQLIVVGVSEAQSSTGTAMPPRGGSTISDEETQSVAAYVWTLSHPEARDSLPMGVTPEMVSLGRRVFSGAGRCAGCHGPDASGDVGPDLTDGEWLHLKGGYLAIVNQVINGVSEEQAVGGIPMPPRGGSSISDDEVHDVAAYVWYIAHQH